MNKMQIALGLTALIAVVYLADGNAKANAKAKVNEAKIEANKDAISELRKDAREIRGYIFRRDNVLGQICQKIISFFYRK